MICACSGVFFHSVVDANLTFGCHPVCKVHIGLERAWFFK